MWDSQFPFGADWHQGQSLNPACDNAVNREFSRFAACNRAVEHGTVDQLTGVVHANVVSACRDSAVALVDHAELQARLGAVHAFTLTVLFQIFHAFCRHLFEACATHSVRTFVDFTQRTAHNINRNGWLFAFPGKKLLFMGNEFAQGREWNHDVSLDWHLLEGGDNWHHGVQRLVRDLSLAERKLVQIARALIDGAARLVVFDEPTAPLEAQEASLVSSAILRLRDQGIAILYISHYLNEIATLCDRGTVLRNGEVVGYPDRDLLQNTEALIAMMVGREIDQLYTPRQRPAADNGATPLLSVRQLSDGRQLQDLSFDIQPGEIVGVAGLLGAGRDVLVDLLYGLRPAERGTIHLEGRPRRIRTPKQAIRAGMALVPRDRRHQGLILPFTTADNINLASLPETATFGWERRGIAEQKARDWIEQLAIRPGRPGLPVRYMSGGNQQKAILARWLGTDARLFILDEPTLGVDIGARRDIYQRTRQLADQGRAVLVSSSDAPELLGLCDRILVLWRGALAANLPTRGLTLDALLVAINGGQEPSP